MGLTLEACKALAQLGYPQDQRQPFWGKLDDEPFTLFYPANRHFKLYGPYMEKYACPSEIEAMDWLEYEHEAHWRYGRDDDGLWFVQNGLRPTRKAYRELGRVLTPSELIMAIFEDWQ